MVPIRTLIRTLFLNVFNRFEIQGIDSKLVLPPCGSSRKLLGALIRILIHTPVCALSTKVTDTFQTHWQRLKWKSVNFPS